MRIFRREAVGFFQGGNQPRDVALAILIGLPAGMLLGANYTLVALLLAAVLLNLHSRTWVVSCLAGLVLGRLLEPVSNRVGIVLLEQSPAAAGLAVLGDGPLATLIGLDHYTWVGAAALALLIATGFSIVALRLTRRLCGRLCETLVEDPFAKRDRMWNLAGRLMFGPGHMRLLTPRAGSSPLLRPWGAVTAVFLVPTALLLPWWMAGQIAKRTLIDKLSVANGAEVDAGSVKLSLWTGQLTIEDLRFTDPRHPDRDRLRIRKVTGRVRPGALLRGHLRADQLNLHGIRVDIAEHGTNVLGDGSDLAANGPAIDDSDVRADATRATGRQLALDHCLRDWDRLRDRIATVGQLIELLSDFGGLEDTGADSGRLAHNRHGRRESRPTRCEPRRGLPRMAARSIHIEDLPRDWRLGPKSAIEITDLSSDPLSSGRPTLVHVVVPRFAAELNLKLNLHEPGQTHDVAVSAYNLSLARMVEVDRYDHGVWFDDGQVDIVGEGWADGRQLYMELQFDARQLQVQMAGQGTVAGLPCSLWNAWFERLEGFEAQAVLAGSWSDPRIEMDRQRLISSLRRQLNADGSEQLIAAINDVVSGPDKRQPPPSGKPLGYVRRAVTDEPPAGPIADALPDSFAKKSSTSPTAVARARRTHEIEPGVYPCTTTPEVWVPRPQPNIAAADAPSTSKRDGHDAIAAQSLVRWATVEGQLVIRPVEPNDSASPNNPGPRTAQATGLADSTVAPALVDLALGYDSEPFHAIDQQIVATEAILEQAAFLDDVLAGENAEPSGLARWSRQARAAVSRAWPFRGRSPEATVVEEPLPLEEPSLAEQDLRQWEPLETTRPAEEMATSTDIKPWYQRLWR